MANPLTYDPARVVALRRRAADTLEDLRAITSDDAGAAGAIRAAGIVRSHLSETWLPLLDGIIASEAMVGWGAGVPLGLVVAAGMGGTAVRPLAGHSDEELLAAYDGAVAALDDPRGMSPSWDEFEAVVHELAWRAEHDPAFAPRVLGWVGWDEMLSGLVTTRFVAAQGMAGDDEDAATWTAGVAAPWGRIIAAAARRDGDLLGRLQRDALHQPIVGELVAAALDDFHEDFVVALTATFLRPDAAAFDSPERLAAAHVLVSALVAHPSLVLELLGQHGALEAITIDDRLHDDDLTSAVMESGLGTAVIQDPSRLPEGGAILDGVVRLAADHEMTTGTLHGLAIALAPYLPQINVMDLTKDGGSVELTVGEDPERDETVPLDSVQRLLGQILGDETGQVLLTQVLAEFGDRQVEQSLELQAAGAGDHEVVRPLIAHAQVVDLALDSIESENARLATSHQERAGAIGSVLALLGAGLSLSPNPVTKPLSTGVRVLGAILPGGQPAYVEPDELRARVVDDAIAHSTATVLKDPALRAEFGWDDDPALAPDLEELLDAYRTAEDLGGRGEIASDITSRLQHAGVDGRMLSHLRELGHVLDL